METIFSIFNILLGLFMVLTGFKIIHPFDKDKEESVMKKFKLFFIIGGTGMFIWGIVGLFI